MTQARLLTGDVREMLRTLPAESIQCVVTSPPYFALRDYNVEGQIGLEQTPAEYVAVMVDVFREVRRVLHPTGTVWLNLGSSYASGDIGSSRTKAKDLIPIPWMVAMALQADGWWLRSDIIWSKPNPMPESVTDRPTRAHEYVFLLTKAARYFYDADAIAEPVVVGYNGSTFTGGKTEAPRPNTGQGERIEHSSRNKRTVWTIATQPFAQAHFATFPEKLVEPCVLAGSREGDTVLDPFAGSGTVGVVALRHGRSFVGIDLNPEYVEMARKRIYDDCPMFNRVEMIGAV